jgi:hypothetical protein
MAAQTAGAHKAGEQIFQDNDGHDAILLMG